MRVVAYPGRGRPRAVAADLEELVLLTQAAISVANTERRVLDRDGTRAAEMSLASLGSARRSTGGRNERNKSYEVTVVDRFYQLAQRSFERRGMASYWERPLPSAPNKRGDTRGRPKAIDIALFNASARSETRIEFGFFTPSKLKEDAKKLHDSRGTKAPDYSGAVRNLIIEWVESDEASIRVGMRTWKETFAAAALRASTKDRSVVFRLASAVDLFSETVDVPRVAYVAVFEVIESSADPAKGDDAPTSSRTGDAPMSSGAARASVALRATYRRPTGAGS